MSTAGHALQEITHFRDLGYTSEEIERIGPISGVEDVEHIVDRYGYDASWRESYRVRSVSAALGAPSLTCIDAALLAYGLLDFLPSVERWILAIHRRSPDGEECGHVATVYRVGDRFGAFSKSNYEGLGHRKPTFGSAHAVARSFAGAYVRMGFTPLVFALERLEEVARDLDWRRSNGDLNVLSDRLIASYAYAFAVNGRGAP